MGTGQYAAQPEAMRSAVGNVGGMIMHASSTLDALKRLGSDPVPFASIGSAVGSANARLQDQVVSALCSLLSLLQNVSGLVTLSADNYQNADADVAASYSGRPAIRPEPGIWSADAGAALAARAMRDSRQGAVPAPHLAESVIGYLVGARPGQLAPHGPGGALAVPIGSAGELTVWLAESPANQARLGVIAVYAGPARGLHDTPGELRPGDVVFIDPGPDAADQEVTVGILGGDGGLHNHGQVYPDFGGVAQVHVYRLVGLPAAEHSGGPWPSPVSKS
jgi:hypothetical protein